MYWFLLILTVVASVAGKKHVVLIVADDLGWNDVSFHGTNQIRTPNIDALAFTGTVLNWHYAGPSGAPARSALLTGKYASRLGMQAQYLDNADPAGLPEGRTMADWFRGLGFSTHAVGRWGLGFSQYRYEPMLRGFDTHLGFYGNHISYYDHLCELKYPNLNPKKLAGYDFRENGSVVLGFNYEGRYATDVFTERAINVIRDHKSILARPMFLYVAFNSPHAGNEGKFLEAPQKWIDKYRHIRDPNRRTYAAMVAKLDDAVGQIVNALNESGMLDETIIGFLSDNGAPTIGQYPNWGSNWPLRGLKDTFLEGGVRTVGLIWSRSLAARPWVYPYIFHATDWLPTLYAAVDGYPGQLGDIDGRDQWSNINQRIYQPPRTEVLYGIDEKLFLAGYRMNRWVFVFGTLFKGALDKQFGASWVSEPPAPRYNVTATLSSKAGKVLLALQRRNYYRETTDYDAINTRTHVTVRCTVPGAPCDPITGCLYDIENDPCQLNNLASLYPGQVAELAAKIKFERNRSAQRRGGRLDVVGADPARFNGTWSNWL